MRSETKVQIGARGGDTTAGGALQETLLDQIRLNNILDRLLLFTNGGGQIIEPYRSTEELIQYGQQQLAIHIVEALLIHIQHIEGLSGHLGTDMAIGADLGVIAHPAQQAVGDARRSRARLAISKAPSSTMLSPRHWALRMTMLARSSTL